MLVRSKKYYFDEKSKRIYLEERTKCYRNLRIVFDINNKFSEKLKATKFLCENYSYFKECFHCLLMVFFLLPDDKDASNHFQEISNFYSQICDYFSESEYFSFFNIQMARFLCKLPVEGDLKYFHITNLVLKNLKGKKKEDKNNYSSVPWAHKLTEEH